MNYLLIIVLLIFAWCLIQGGKKGFLRGLFGLISWVFVLIVCNVATPIVAEYIIEETQIDETIEEKLSVKLRELVIDGAAIDIQENIPAELESFLQMQGVDIEEILASNSQMLLEALEIENTIINIVAFIIVLAVSGISVVISIDCLGTNTV